MSASPLKVHKVKEKGFSAFLLFSGTLVLMVLGAFFVTLVLQSFPLFRETGLKFFTTSRWVPMENAFSVLPFIAGTLMTSFLSILIAFPFSMALSILLGEYIKTGPFAAAFKSVTELLAGIPSVIYGFWGIMILMPLVQSLQIKLGVIPYGVGVLTASLILSLMIIPYAASLGRDVISMVPGDLKEAAYAMGATRFEVVAHIILPYARSGITAGFFLALGRAVGETMAVTMLIGNSNFIPKGIFSPANTMASVIANEFGEADGMHTTALIAVGLVLMLLTGIINSIGKSIMKRFQVGG
ncbi:MAG TPA: phosphate ABC transporter permease subunit PstC [Firmicutes bacterium]|nr:phosphate ABC transporter permease subunit PstC [Bacillota bacterium]